MQSLILLAVDVTWNSQQLPCGPFCLVYASSLHVTCALRFVPFCTLHFVSFCQRGSWNPREPGVISSVLDLFAMFTSVNFTQHM